MISAAVPRSARAGAEAIAVVGGIGDMGHICQPKWRGTFLPVDKIIAAVRWVKNENG